MRPCKNTLINKHVVHAAPKSPRKCKIAHLTMRLGDAGLRQPKSTLLYLNHRLPPWLNEDDTPRLLEPLVSVVDPHTPEVRHPKTEG